MVSIDKDHVADSQILVVTENGYGKRTKVVDEDVEDVYRITNRGGKGVKTLQVTEKTGKLISIKNVSDEDDLMIINKKGITIRMDLKSIRVMGRATQGVRLINLGSGDSIAAVAKVPHEDEELENELDSEFNDVSDKSDNMDGTDNANEEENNN